MNPIVTRSTDEQHIAGVDDRTTTRSHQRFVYVLRHSIATMSSVSLVDSCASLARLSIRRLFLYDTPTFV